MNQRQGSVGRLPERTQRRAQSFLQLVESGEVPVAGYILGLIP
jgi:hypothetical protein